MNINVSCFFLIFPFLCLQLNADTKNNLTVFFCCKYFLLLFSLSTALLLLRVLVSVFGNILFCFHSVSQWKHSFIFIWNWVGERQSGLVARYDQALLCDRDQVEVLNELLKNFKKSGQHTFAGMHFAHILQLISHGNICSTYKIRGGECWVMFVEDWDEGGRKGFDLNSSFLIKQSIHTNCKIKTNVTCAIFLHLIINNLLHCFDWQPAPIVKFIDNCEHDGRLLAKNICNQNSFVQNSELCSLLSQCV